MGHLRFYLGCIRRQFVVVVVVCFLRPVGNRFRFDFGCFAVCAAICLSLHEIDKLAPCLCRWRGEERVRRGVGGR